MYSNEAVLLRAKEGQGPKEEDILDLNFILNNWIICGGFSNFHRRKANYKHAKIIEIHLAVAYEWKTYVPQHYTEWTLEVTEFEFKRFTQDISRN